MGIDYDQDMGKGTFWICISLLAAGFIYAAIGIPSAISRHERLSKESCDYIGANLFAERPNIFIEQKSGRFLTVTLHSIDPRIYPKAWACKTQRLNNRGYEIIPDSFKISTTAGWAEASNTVSVIAAFTKESEQ